MDDLEPQPPQAKGEIHVFKIRPEMLGEAAGAVDRFPTIECGAGRCAEDRSGMPAADSRFPSMPAFPCEAAAVVLIASGVDERRQSRRAAIGIVLQNQWCNSGDAAIGEPRQRRVGPALADLGVVVEQFHEGRGRGGDTGVRGGAEPAGARDGKRPSRPRTRSPHATRSRRASRHRRR